MSFTPHTKTPTELQALETLHRRDAHHVARLNDLPAFHRIPRVRDPTAPAPLCLPQAPEQRDDDSPSGCRRAPRFVPTERQRPPRPVSDGQSRPPPPRPTRTGRSLATDPRRLVASGGTNSVGSSSLSSLTTPMFGPPQKPPRKLGDFLRVAIARPQERGSPTGSHAGRIPSRGLAVDVLSPVKCDDEVLSPSS